MVHIGAVTISPSPMATVCNVGDRLEVNCTATGSVLTWTLMYSSGNGMAEQHSEIITSSLMTQPTIRHNSSVITFMRRSESRMTPLVSSVEIGSVSVAQVSMRNKGYLHGIWYNIRSDYCDLYCAS